MEYPCPMVSTSSSLDNATVTIGRFTMAAQVGRVPSMVVPLDQEHERRFERLMDDLLMIDMHQHVQVLPEPVGDLFEHARERQYAWGYDAARAGGWSTVTTANGLSTIGFTREMSFVSFDDLATEIALMLADVAKQGDAVMPVSRSTDILAAQQRGALGWLPTVEHLALDPHVHRVDTLYGLGVRLGGLTYTRKTYTGDGQMERGDGGLSEFGLAVVERMNDLGMIVDLSHANARTAHEAIAHSKAPTIFSHNAAKAVWETARTRADADFVACAERGGLVCVTAVPNSLSDDPRQDITCVLDHYDYLVKLIGVDHVGIGTDTLIGDHVGFHKTALYPGDTSRRFPAPYLSGLESPADGKNIIRGLISRGHSDEAIRKIAGQNALDLIRRVVG